MEKLIVSEVFYSIQGEGITMGVPSVFLRLGGCNLFCNGSWRCDSIEVWQKGRATDFTTVLMDDYIERLRNGAHLIITGGEPLIHQVQIKKYLEWFQLVYGFIPVIEIETNGTIIAQVQIFHRLKVQFNCSPKLSNSGEPKEKRINPLALDSYKRFGGGAIYKFVIKNEEDILELLQDYSFLDFKEVVLMPAGDSREQLEVTRPLVVDQCINLGLRYCDRLHIINWNKKTGV